jgi:hypothetical protein
MHIINANVSAAHLNIFVLIDILIEIQSEIKVSLRNLATRLIKKTAEKENI